MSRAKPVVKRRYYTRIMNAYRRWDVHVPGLPSIIRWLLVFRSYSQGLATRLRSGGRQAEIEGWLADRQLFFIHCLPRSGSTFLATFLNEAVDDAMIQHEPNVNDYYHYCRALADADDAREYVEQERIADIYFRARPHGLRCYGEVNPFLRRHCDALAASLPQAALLHLVRDGRDVVRSILSREMLAPNDPMAPLIRPPPSDPYHERWDGMERFEQVCWMWQADNAWLRARIPDRIRLEDLLSSYECFKASLLVPLGLSIEHAAWQARVRRVTNATPAYRVPEYADWPAHWKQSFSRICGEEMTACGYDMPV